MLLIFLIDLVFFSDFVTLLHFNLPSYLYFSKHVHWRN